MLSKFLRLKKCQTSVLNNPDQNKIQEIYVLLKELTKTAKNQDKDMFLLKYVKLMEKMIAII